MARGRPVGAGHVTFGAAAARLLDNGYAPIPIRPGAKVPAVSRWSRVEIDEGQVEAWSRAHAGCGIGLRTGALVGVDIDLTDPEIAHAVHDLARKRLGATLLRVGRWPKRLLLYRTETPIPKMHVSGVEILGAGQQFVAFGLHPDTGRAYSWPDGDSPLDVAFDDLPLVAPAQLEAVLAEAAALLPDADRPRNRARAGGTGRTEAGAGPVRDETGRVVDGRDGWLSSIAYHAVQDALDRGEVLDAGTLAERVWARFAETTDLDRPGKDGRAHYGPTDASRKVADKLRLHRKGRLPPRGQDEIEAEHEAPTTPVDMARDQLNRAIRAACDRILGWHGCGIDGVPAPRIGLRATVGLGKSAVSRRALVDLRRRLRDAGHPDRIAVFTPSHALAEEAAGAWRDLGVTAAVLRGYERNDPATGGPMCRDLAAVRAALAAGLDVQQTVCAGRTGARCPHFEGCAKQRNRAGIAAADVVLAPYDALYTGFAVVPETVGAIVIDEGCWARALRSTIGLLVETLDTTGLTAFGASRTRIGAAAGMADLAAVRGRLREALASHGPDPLRRSALAAAGLSPAVCRDAIALEKRQLGDPGLRPGQTAEARAGALGRAGQRAQILDMIRLWSALAALLDGTAESDGQVSLAPPDPKTGLRRITCLGLAEVHPNLRDLPVLHLDATLRPGIAGRLLPGLEVTEIDAAAPHMSVTLVAGRFGKTAIVPDGGCSDEEHRRRSRNLADCVDHVRWQARRLGRVLVVTYKAIEAAFAGIPGVETAHFNALAGLDLYKHVDGLIVIGRPLPRDSDLQPFCAAFEGHVPAGGYAGGAAGIRMRDGTSRTVRVMRHADPLAERFRAAICDDELIQAIGRGRGVNRTADTPLDVQILADVALPLVHDQLVPWDSLRPDIFQRMLLAGLAVDSPADAAVLHPEMFGSANAAKLAFQRDAVFKGQTPIENSYRDLTLKSAAYRRPGRGRAWQRAWWLDGDADAARARLETAVGPLASWEAQTDA